MLLGSFVEEYDDEDEDEDGQLPDPETPIRQTASPDELSSVSNPLRSHRESTNQATPPPFFLSRPTG